MFEDILTPLPFERWYPSGCVKFDEHDNGICSVCDIQVKCKCYRCPVMGIDCLRCVDG